MNCQVNSSPASFSISVATDLMLKILENIMEVISLKKICKYPNMHLSLEFLYLTLKPNLGPQNKNLYSRRIENFIST